MAAPQVKLVGGVKMEKVLAQIQKRAGKGSFVKVGYLEGSVYPTGISVAQVAFWDEFGTKISPPRPTFRPMIANGTPRWGKELGTVLKTKGYDATASLDVMGLRMAEELTESVVNTQVAPLSEVTLVLRKMKDEGAVLPLTFADVLEARRRVAAGEKGASGTRAKPLIDTGTMQRAPAHEVETK